MAQRGSENCSQDNNEIVHVEMDPPLPIPDSNVSIYFSPPNIKRQDTSASVPIMDRQTSGEVCDLSGTLEITS